MNQAGQVNILILDNDEEIQKVFQSLGSQNGYSIDFVSEAYTALLRIVKGQLPDIFFIQPTATGNAAYELCQVASNNKIAVIIMDKEATQEKVSLATRAGAKDFLLKSAGENIITGKIRRILEHQGKIAPQTKKFTGIDFGNKELTALEKINIILEKAQGVVAMPNSVAKVVALCRNEKVGAAENEILKTTHSFIGGRIAEVWKFHQDITDAIKNHHNYEAAFPGEGNSFNLATFVFLGNILAKAMLLGCGGDYLVSAIPDAIFAKLGFGKTIPREFIDGVYNDLDEFFQILNIPKEMRPKRAAAESSEKRILLLGSGRTVNGFARVYLANQGYRVTLAEEIGEDKELNYDLIIYDCPETVSPEKKESFRQLAKKSAQLPAVFLQGTETDLAELPKFYKEPEVLGQPLDMFLLDQVIKKSGSSSFPMHKKEERNLVSAYS